MRRSLPEAELIAVYQETIRALYAFASRRVGGHREMAEDLVQETWMRAVEDWSRRRVELGAAPRSELVEASLRQLSYEVLVQEAQLELIIVRRQLEARGAR